MYKGDNWEKKAGQENLGCCCRMRSPVLYSKLHSPTYKMAYHLTVKVLSCSAPVGDYYVGVSLNKPAKKDKRESKTEVIKKSAKPTWNYTVELYVYANRCSHAWSMSFRRKLTQCFSLNAARRRQLTKSSSTSTNPRNSCTSAQNRFTALLNTN